MLRRQEYNSSVLRQLVCEERGFRAISNELTNFLSRMSIGSSFQTDSVACSKSNSKVSEHSEESDVRSLTHSEQYLARSETTALITLTWLQGYEHLDLFAGITFLHAAEWRSSDNILF